MTGSRSKGRGGRGRSRKRRPARGAVAVNGSPGPSPSQSQTGGDKAVTARSRAHARRRAERPDAAHGSSLRGGAGERPPSLWHPWPLSELLILVGAVGVVFGMMRLSHGGFANGGAVLFAGLGAVSLGTFEVTLREHRAGYRSHALMLAFLPVLVFHTVIVLGVSALVTLPGSEARWLNVGVFVLDLAIFAVLFKLLRTSFRDARTRRAVGGR
jgi:hypothetical protein